MNTSAMVASSIRELRELASLTVSLQGRGVKCYRNVGNRQAERLGDRQLLWAAGPAVSFARYAVARRSTSGTGSA